MRTPLFTVRSYYSLLRGAVSPARLVERAAELGYGAVALADVNSLAGGPEFWRAARQADLIPILGVEILTDTERVTLLAQNTTGYHHLCCLVSAQQLDTEFDFLEQLAAYRQGLIAIGHQPWLLKRMARILRRGHLFASPKLLGAGGHGRAAPLACATVNILDGQDIPTARLLSRIRALGLTGAGPAAGGFECMVPGAEWKRFFSQDPQALAQAENLVERCSFDLLGRGLCLPRVPSSHGIDAYGQLARRCHVGLARRYETLTRPMIQRLEKELEAIQSHGFCDYFLVVQRIVQFAKDRDIPVEVRGSAAGSLVSHVLGFTRVCPLANGLYFERFMNPGRTDCPDIDVDLCWRRRDEVIRFCYEHWGADHVAMVCNINRFRQRGAIRDTARALRLAPAQVDRVAEAPDAFPRIASLARRLQGIPRHLGVHCGGVIITPQPVSELAPLTRATKGVVIAQYDKRAAEAVGLVKIDLLSNRALSTVHEAVTILQRGGEAVDIERQARGDDQASAALLQRGDSLGVFQSESPGMRQLLQGLQVKNPRELAVALSLIRPGPAQGGMKAEFIARHVHGKRFDTLHPRLAGLLAETHGVMLYQEDVMRIAIELAGYSVAEADRFRSEVSKKVSSTRLQAQYRDFVYRRADSGHLNRESAERLWDQILQFAAYSFCKAHATVYAHIAWQTAFLKEHHPLAFYCALLNNHRGMYPLRVYVWDAKRHGLSVRLPHVNHGSDEWTVETDVLRAGLGLVKGLAHDTIQQLIRKRRQGGLFRNLDDLRRRVSFRRGQLPILVALGACDGLASSRPSMLEQLQFAPRDPQQPLLFDPYRAQARVGRDDYSADERLQAELTHTGIPFSGHPETRIQTRHIRAKNLAQFVNQEVTVAGFVACARRARTQDGRVMGFVTVEDASGLVEVSFFPDQLDVYQRVCRNGGPIWVRGRVCEHLSSVTVEGKQGGEAA